MPRLLLFGMCQKAIIDNEDGAVSMISLLHGITIQTNEPLKPDATIPYNWAAVSAWLQQPEDEGKTFEQLVNVAFPNGNTMGESTLLFKMSEKTQQVTVRANAFPVGQAGVYTLQLFLREVKEEEGEEWGEPITLYPFEVIHSIQKGEVKDETRTAEP